MFTGLIEGIGTLQRTDRLGPDARMVIRAGFRMENIVLGESISVDGACLTVVDFQQDALTADVSAETLSRTTLGRKGPGSGLNLERALRLGARLGGHLVTGHIDGIAVLKERRSEGRSLRLFFEAPPEIMKYVIEKGSIAIDGVSLTVNGVSSGGFRCEYRSPYRIGDHAERLSDRPGGQYRNRHDREIRGKNGPGMGRHA